MKHAENIMPPEFTLCGVAADAFESGHSETPIEFATAGQIVTCKACRTLIDYCKTFKAYRSP